MNINQSGIVSKHRWIKVLFFALLVKPIVFIILGLNIRNRQGLPQLGPSIIAANHTSHLDALVLMSLFPLSQIHNVRPVAAADYFMCNQWIAWFAVNCLDIIPFDRLDRSGKNSLFKTCYDALDQQQIIILFPGGTRSSPKQSISELKRGIYHLIHERPQTTVIPVLLQGLGKALPKGTALFVPFNCDVMIDDVIEITPDDTARNFVNKLEMRYQALQEFCVTDCGDDID